MAEIPRRSARQVARGLYEKAFAARSRSERGKAIRDWLELSEGERGYAMCHLLYLNLEAHGETQALLKQIRDVLEDTDEAVQQMADELSEDKDAREVELPEPEGETPREVAPPARARAPQPPPEAERSGDVATNQEETQREEVSREN